MRQCAVVVWFVLVLSSAAFAQGLIDRWTWPEDAANLVTNGGFEAIDIAGKPTGWALSPVWGTPGFSLSGTIAHSGSRALVLSNPKATLYTDYGVYSLTIPDGYYSFRCWTRLDGQTTGANTAAGYRCEMVPGNVAPTLSGTRDWTQTGARMFPSGGAARVRVTGYAEPDGTAYWDDIEVHRHVPPSTEMFLLYPNYLGNLWADGPQRVTVAVRGAGSGKVTVRAGTTTLKEAAVDLAAAWTTVALDLPGGLTTARACLEVAGSNYTPCYDVTGRQRGAIRIDPDLIYAQPGPDGVSRRIGLPVLVYHTGAYFADEAGWASMLDKFAGIPYDLYLNYWLGLAPNSSLEALGRYLAKSGRAYVDTINDFYLGDVKPNGPGGWPLGPDAKADVPRTTARVSITGKPGIAGWYVADELRAQGFWGVEDQRKLLVSLNGAGRGFSFGTQGNMPLGQLQRELETERDLLDIVSVDPYPVRSNNLNPDGSHKLEEVVTMTRAAVAAVQDARPVWTTIQFWGGPSGFTWPTKDELLNMSYLAVCAGARGLTYWSLGGGGGWYNLPDAQKPTALQMLVDVTTEMKKLDAFMASPVAAVPALPAGMIGVARQTAPNTVTVLSCNPTNSAIGDVVAYGHKRYDVAVTPPPPPPPDPAPSPTPSPTVRIITGTDQAGKAVKVTIEEP